MKNYQIKEAINRVVIFVLTFAFAIFYAQPSFPPVPGGSGGGGVGPGQPEQTPISMYEGALLGVAVFLIIGYYFYMRNRRIANS